METENSRAEDLQAPIDLQLTNVLNELCKGTDGTPNSNWLRNRDDREIPELKIKMDSLHDSAAEGMISFGFVSAINTTKTFANTIVTESFVKDGIQFITMDPSHYNQAVLSMLMRLSDESIEIHDYFKPEITPFYDLIFRYALLELWAKYIKTHKYHFDINEKTQLSFQTRKSILANIRFNSGCIPILLERLNNNLQQEETNSVPLSNNVAGHSIGISSAMFLKNAVTFSDFFQNSFTREKTSEIVLFKASIVIDFSLLTILAFLIRSMETAFLKKAFYNNATCGSIAMLNSSAWQLTCASSGKIYWRKIVDCGLQCFDKGVPLYIPPTCWIEHGKIIHQPDLIQKQAIQ